MKHLTIDLVSDVVCPWCAIGYGHLSQALNQLEHEIQADIQWHPFQLNPYMGKEGQEINEHLAEKYGLNEQQLADNKKRIQAVGAQAGIDFNFDQRSRIYNTLDCHVLLHLANESGKQTQLKLALFKAYFSEGKDISDREVLVDIVASVGIETQAVLAVLDDDEIREGVKQEEAQFKQMGIESVPAFIINNKYLISGGQPVEAFVQGLQEISEKEA